MLDESKAGGVPAYLVAVKTVKEGVKTTNPAAHQGDRLFHLGVPADDGAFD